MQLKVNILRNLWVAMGAIAMSCAMADESVSPALGRLDGREIITEADVSSYLDVRVDLRATSKNAWGVENIVREMALTRALVLEGAETGVSLPEGRSAERFDDIYARSVFRSLRPECEPPKDDVQTRKFYDETPKAFSVPPMARLSRIILPKTIPIDGEPAVGWLLAQIQAVGAQAKTFDEVAQRAEESYRLDPQGDLGWVVMTDEIPLMRALGNSGEGDIVGPITEGEFLYAFKIVSKRDGRVLPWDAVAASAAGRAVRYCREQGDTQIRDRLTKKYGIEVDTSAIRAMFSRIESKEKVTQ